MALELVRKLKQLDIKAESDPESKLKQYASDLDELVKKLNNQQSMPSFDFIKTAIPSTSGRSRRRSTEEFTGINFYKLANDEKHDLNEVIKLYEHDLDSLFEKVYASLTKRMSDLAKNDVRGGYPSYLRLEDFKSSFVKRRSAL